MFVASTVNFTKLVHPVKRGNFVSACGIEMFVKAEQLSNALFPTFIVDVELGIAMLFMPEQPEKALAPIVVNNVEDIVTLVIFEHPEKELAPIVVNDKADIVQVVNQDVF